MNIQVETIQFHAKKKTNRKKKHNRPPRQKVARNTRPATPRKTATTTLAEARIAALPIATPTATGYKIGGIEVPMGRYQLKDGKLYDKGRPVARLS